MEEWSTEWMDMQKWKAVKLGLISYNHDRWIRTTDWLQWTIAALIALICNTCAKLAVRMTWVNSRPVKLV